ncbi:putative F-box domain-containing protein [Rosa chinensis]|uniref:Putative F-box domain-containing protein n=2 Tax=Rosa chinensis TaxID=74649 RepID=A0A2P6Q9A4_ROSCH|nr:F-box protein CPR1 isoform X1 [Rosa chinensis]PRQ30756.1 putative F-box domain-containing protein [Rosa chinensis]
MIDSFPEEISHDILSRLPIKCLIRCTSVSKPLLSIIKNSGFIRAHLRRRNETLLLLHSRCYRASTHEGIEEVYRLHCDNPAFDEYCRIDFQVGRMVDPINGRFRVAGICDGLVCLADDLMSKALSYIIWNPSIRKAVTLPRPGFTFATHGSFEDSIGFGFDATTNDYKVVRLVTLEDLVDEDVENRTVAEVYSLATGSWRSLGSVGLPCQIFCIRPHAFFNGNIHWVVHAVASFYFILAFDLVSESFRKILIPIGTKLGFNSRVSVTGDGKYLALFTWYNDNHISYLDIWVMKEYCQQESWTKMITLAPQGPEGSVRPKPFCFRKSGEVFLELREPDFYCRYQTLVSLDPVSQQMNNVDILDCECYSLDSYEESLVLLDVENAVSC